MNLRDYPEIKPFLILFFCTMGLFILINGIWSANVDDCDQIRSESFTTEAISQVIAADERLYVCYEQNRRVNVYDAQGSFLWGIRAPYIRNCRFSLMDGVLLLFDHDGNPAYTYDASTGTYLGAPSQIQLPQRQPDASPAIDSLAPGQIGWDRHNVYRMADGATVKLISRPWWYALIDPLVMIGIGVASFFLILVLLALRFIKETADMDEASVCRPVRNAILANKAGSVLWALNALLSVCLLPFFPLYVLSLIFLGIFYIFSHVIPGVPLSKVFTTLDEDALMQKWELIAHACMVGSILVTVFTLVLSDS